jgi:biotin transport system substrate-specific component
MSPLVRRLVLVLAFAILMAVGAWLDLPMVPVPMTMQSFAVLLAGAVMGPLWGALAVLIYLGAAAVGLPVLSDGAGGLAPFTGPTAGYLIAFPVVACLAGVAARLELLDGWVRGSAVLFGLHLILLGLGVAWLASSLGLEAAWRGGGQPFLVGAAVKSVLVLAAYRYWPVKP